VLRGLQDLAGRLVSPDVFRQLARAAQRAARGGGGASVMPLVLDSLPAEHRGAPQRVRMTGVTRPERAQAAAPAC